MERNRSVVQDFKGVGEENRHRRQFEFDADEPEVLLGRDLGANPVEHLLAAVTACVTSALVYHAAARGIEIKQLESRTEGHIDLRGFLGIDDTIPRGYQRIKITFRIEADVPDEELAELVKLGPTYSPVYDTVTRAVAAALGSSVAVSSACSHRSFTRSRSGLTTRFSTRSAILLSNPESRIRSRCSPALARYV